VRSKLPFADSYKDGETGIGLQVEGSCLTAVTLFEWLSKLSTGCGLFELTSKRRICGFPAAASSCLSVVISSLFTCINIHRARLTM